MAFNLDSVADLLRSHGLKVVETEGWINRGYAGQDLQGVRAVMWHHTATNRNAFTNSNAPTLNLCTYGRSDLPGPLANIVFGRDGTCYILATGVANHAGTGSYPGIPANMGNHWTIGIEMESSGIAPWDWTVEQLREAPKLGAALELGYMQHLPPAQRLQIAHYEYSDAGKIDPAGWPGGMDGLRESINNQIAAWSDTKAQSNNITPIQEDDLMATPEQRALLIQELLDTKITRADVGGTTSLRSVIAHLDANLGKIPEEVVSFQFPKQGYNEKGVKFTDLKPAPMTSVKTELGWQDGGNIAIRNKVDQVKK